MSTFVRSMSTVVPSMSTFVPSMSAFVRSMSAVVLLTFVRSCGAGAAVGGGGRARDGAAAGHPARPGPVPGGHRAVREGATQRAGARLQAPAAGRVP
eukprot:1195431-Prorocentrum_minimum.AAC.9